MNNKEDFKLLNNWNLWFHNLESSDWSINGYEKVQKIECIRDFWITLNNIDLTIGMYYLMKDDTIPLWDYKDNIEGYTYTYKCFMNDTQKVFYNLSASMINNTLFQSCIGISTSPKSKFNIIRLWSSKILTEKDIIDDTYFKLSEWKVIKNNS